jgi:hypothetical protein
VLAMVAVIVGVDVLIFKAPALAAPGGKRRDRAGIRGVLFQVREASMRRGGRVGQ